MDRVHIIAEAGTNHNGSRETAIRLINVALDARADSVKFQIIYPESLYLPRFYENGRYADNSVFGARARNAMTDEDYRHLANYCNDKGIAFSASVFDSRGLKLIDELQAPYVKIASCDLNNSKLLCEAASLGRKLVVSTGMATLGEIEHAVKSIEGTGNSDLVLMHCVSVYPSRLEAMNLAFLPVLQKAFGFPVGLSDHTEGDTAAAIAVGMGAEWIEKHYTLDHTSPGFDHSYALEPEDLYKFVETVRKAEKACSGRADKITPEEKGTRVRARRALYAARDMEASEVVKESDVLVVRPESTMSPDDLPSILGKKTTRFIHQYEAFSPDCFRK